MIKIQKDLSLVFSHKSLSLILINTIEHSLKSLKFRRHTLYHQLGSLFKSQCIFKKDSLLWLLRCLSLNQWSSQPLPFSWHHNMLLQSVDKIQWEDWELANTKDPSGTVKDLVSASKLGAMEQLMKEIGTMIFVMEMASRGDRTDICTKVSGSMIWNMAKVYGQSRMAQL